MAGFQQTQQNTTLKTDGKGGVSISGPLDHLTKLLQGFQDKVNSSRPNPEQGAVDQAAVNQQSAEGQYRVLNEAGAPPQMPDVQPGSYPTRTNPAMPKEVVPHVSPLAGIAGVVAGAVAPNRAGDIYAGQVGQVLQAADQDRAIKAQKYGEQVAVADKQYQDALSQRNDDIKYRLLNQQRQFENSTTARQYQLDKGLAGVAKDVPATIGKLATARGEAEKKFANDQGSLQAAETGIKLGSEAELNQGHGAYFEAEAAKTHTLLPYQETEASNAAKASSEELAQAKAKTFGYQLSNSEKKQSMRFDAELQQGRVTGQTLQNRMKIEDIKGAQYDRWYKGQMLNFQKYDLMLKHDQLKAADVNGAYKAVQTVYDAQQQRVQDLQKVRDQMFTAMQKAKDIKSGLSQQDITNAQAWFAKSDRDLEAAKALLPQALQDYQARLNLISQHSRIKGITGVSEPGSAGTGQALDQATAQKLLQEAGGDNNKARQLAIQRGYKL